MNKEYELDSQVVVSWVDGISPEDWRKLPDLEDEDEDDEDLPCPGYVSEVLGFDPDDEDWSEVEPVENVFCPTGKGGGVDPTCKPGGKGPSVSPINKVWFKEKGATDEEIKVVSRLLREQTKLNKKKKAGTITDEEKTELDKVGAELDSVRKGIRERHEAGGGEKEKPPETRPPEVKKEKKPPEVKKESSREDEARKRREGIESSRQLGSHSFDSIVGPESKLPPAEQIRLIKEKSTEVKFSHKIHGMSAPLQNGRMIKVEGTRIYYEEGDEYSVMGTIRNGKKVHPEFWNKNTSITLSPHRNAQDDAHASRMGLPPGSFTSLATGGDGAIVVYSGNVMSTGDLAHESAHNLEHRLFGRTGVPDKGPSQSTMRSSLRPDLNRKISFEDRDSESPMLMDTVRVRNAVTRYGTMNRSEDFAEFAAAYQEVLIEGKLSYREATKSKLLRRPVTLRSMALLLGDDLKDRLSADDYKVFQENLAKMGKA